ncbi:hypothetical protein MNBD_GAMMA12-195 [hydrothermal vent metagenome]|uniref:Uncharacterized protein n=1 Tax=hydrothermal vent metagenome TaxID=652676 RepID=A0A3B0Z192_9ZZZZ
MSTLQLSDVLLQDIQAVLLKHDEKCNDMGVGIQYLAALTGFLASTLPGEGPQKQEFLQQLYQFAEQVMVDNSQKKEGTATLPPANNNAFGIWEPK